MILGRNGEIVKKLCKKVKGKCEQKDKSGRKKVNFTVFLILESAIKVQIGERGVY